MKAKKAIANALKQRRKELNMSAEDVIKELSYRGITLKEVTLYGYENAVSSPNVNTFLALCAIYHIENVMEYFGDCV
jgi:transcriptional regulator with XRE-family HTH domain